MKYGYWYMLILTLLFSCQTKQEEVEQRMGGLGGSESEDLFDGQLFEFVDSAQSGIDFVNTLISLDILNIFTYEYFYNGGGVAIGDINNDGLPDIYFTSNMGACALYLNKGNFTFENIAASAGVEAKNGFNTGVTMVDINGDGLLDIYVCRSAVPGAAQRQNLLFINNGDLTFSERAAEYGLADQGYSVKAYFFDADGDGDLDAYILNHPGNIQEANIVKVTVNEKGERVPVEPASYEFVSDRLYQNNNGRFTDVTEKAGLLNFAFGLSAIMSDFNDDGLLDIFLCNDYYVPDRLLINKGNMRFEDQFDRSFQHSSFSSMGSALGDINNNGCQDLLVLDMVPRDNYRNKLLSMGINYRRYQEMIAIGYKSQLAFNNLHLNNCDGTFSDIAFYAGLQATDWSWTPILQDFDNDGWKDVYISNGFRKDLTNQDFTMYHLDSLKKGGRSQLSIVDLMPEQSLDNYIFRNNRNLKFKNMQNTWMKSHPSWSNGAAYADLDGDGKLDLVVNNFEQPAFILKNVGPSDHNYLRVELKAGKGKSLSGTRVRITDSEGLIQLQEYNPDMGFLSSNEPIIHFGVGKASSVQKMEIFWGDGTLQTVENPGINQTLQIEQSANLSDFALKKHESKGFFVNETKEREIDFKHIENDYIDYKREPLLHKKYSREGPALAVGDVNGDGLEDFYVGGAKGQEGVLFIQKKNGKFTMQNVSAFAKDSVYEDVVAVFFDANGDGFLDLFVGSGGNEYPDGHELYTDRLYLGDGKGQFKRDERFIPGMRSSTGAVVVKDFDKDGKPDLFIGSRLKANFYPQSARSYILKNEGNRMVDATQSVCIDFQDLGLVTDLLFADINGDGEEELLVAAEWKPLRIYKKSGFRYALAEDQMGLHKYPGMWHKIWVADVDGDGLADIVAGNIGLNGHFRANPSEPMSIMGKDFDGNGTVESIISYYIDGVSHPLAHRDRLLDQMVSLKKHFLRYKTYATLTTDELMQLLDTSSMINKQVTELRTGIFYGDKESAAFEFSPLSSIAQFSVVTAIEGMDINGSGKLDLILAGNDFSFDPQNGRYDASYGAFFENLGGRKFASYLPGDSGLSIPGNVRRLAVIQLGTSGQKGVLFARNNQSLQLIRLQKNVQ